MKDQINKDIAKKILNKASIKHKLVHLKKVKEESLNSIYILKTNRKEYTLRVFDGEFVDYGISWKAKKEEYIYKRLINSKVKSPRFIYKDISKSIIPFDYVLLEYLKGEPLYNLDGMKLGKRRSSSLPKEDHLNILEEIGEQMAIIHQLNMPKIGIFDSRPEKGTKFDLLKDFKSKIWKISNKKVKEKIIDYIKKVGKKLPKNPKLVPIHKELSGRNIIVTKNKKWKLSGIIDMEVMVNGFPELEFAHSTIDLLGYNKKYFKTRLKSLLKGYYKKGGRIKNPELIPFFIIYQLIGTMKNGKTLGDKKKLNWIKLDLEIADEIVEKYVSVIKDIEQK